MFEKSSTTKLSRRIIPFIVSLFVLAIALMAVNGYQYWRIKQQIAGTVLLAVNGNEVERLRSFMEDVEQKLNLVRGWGENGLLDIGETDELNKQLFPLLQPPAPFSGIVLASDRGEEYFLSRHDQGYLVRRVRQQDGEAVLSYQLWENPIAPGAAWQKRGKYTPVERPWFTGSGDEELVNWTSLYTFYELKQEGVTASLGWRNPDRPDELMVVGIDILFSTFEELLQGAGAGLAGEYFLVNDRGETVAGSRVGNTILPRQVSGDLVSRYVSDWQAAGRPIGQVGHIRHDSRTWLASVQPLLHEGKSLWFGVMIPEKVLLERLEYRWYRLDTVDGVVVLAVGIVLLVYLYRFGGWRGHEPERLTPLARLTAYLEGGEGPRTEFKSTVRMNLQSGKHGKEIELAWLKALAAFMNTSGGALLIGVDDAGKVVGLKPDGFMSDDKLLLHVKNLVHHHLGPQYTGLIESTLVDIESEAVLMLECYPATEPVFLKIGKSEEFYVRSGPSSAKLSPSQMVGHVLQARS